MLFISYSTKDRAVATEVYDRLIARGYHVPFLDYHPDSGISGGADWRGELRWQLKVAKGVVVLCSENWKVSDWCRDELGAANALSKCVIPLNIDGCDLPPTITTYQQIDFRQRDDEAYNRLWRALEESRLRPGDDFHWPRDECPYPGLEAFQEEHAAVYCGRDNELIDVLDELQSMRCDGRRRLLYVLGPSGSGKSSFVRAGILPRLRFKLGQNWLVFPVFRWSELQARGEPWVEWLATAIEMEYRGHVSPHTWESLRQRYQCDDSPQSIVTAAENFIKDSKELCRTLDRHHSTPLWVLDQFEELLSLSNDPAVESPGRFMKFLAHVLTSPHSPWRAVATVRSDFGRAVQQCPDLSALNARFRLFRLDFPARARFFEIICKPAEYVGVNLEQGLAERIVYDSQTDDALPLLSFTMREFYERFGRDRRLTLDEYERKPMEGLGGLDGCLLKVTTDAVSGLRPGLHVPANPQVAENALRLTFVKHLATINDRGDFVRRPAKWSELPPDAKPLLENLWTMRLLTIRGEGDERIVEVSHDALFRVWDKPAGWLKDRRDLLNWRRDVERDRSTSGKKWTGLTRSQLAVARDWPNSPLKYSRTPKTPRKNPLKNEVVCSGFEYFNGLLSNVRAN